MWQPLETENSPAQQHDMGVFDQSPTNSLADLPVWIKSADHQVDLRPFGDPKGLYS